MASARGVSEAQPVTDAEFVAQLRTATARYLGAIDAWEAAHRKYYRMPAPAPVSHDLEREQEEFLSARDQLRRSIPRARRLCLKHSLRDPWPGMLHVNLGARTPQSGTAPAMGRAERGIIGRCLSDLELACRAPAAPDSGDSADSIVPPASERPGIFRKIIDYFV